MKQFVSVGIKGDNILHSYYEDNKKYYDKIKYQPTLYLSTNKQSEYKTLLGTPVVPYKCDSIYSAKSLIKKYSEISGIDVHGRDNYQQEFLVEEYEGTIDPDYSLLNIVTVDIETLTEHVTLDDKYPIKVKKGNLEKTIQANEIFLRRREFEKVLDNDTWVDLEKSSFYVRSFPDVISADKEISLITLDNSKTNEIITFGVGECNKEGKNYVTCSNEKELLRNFLYYWTKNYPDIVTGWNSEFFDIPYIVNRIKRIFGEEAACKLSPFGIVRDKMVWNKNKEELTYLLEGISCLDYLAVYQKFSLTKRENYKLDYIAEVELDENKLENPYPTFHEFYTLDWDRFVEYNIHDVRLVRKLEDKLQLIRQITSVGYEAKTNFVDIFKPTKTWDSIITNYLKPMKIVPPKQIHKEKVPYGGGHVEDPLVGRHKWVITFDATSLYPSIMESLNISPETLLGVMSNFDFDVYKPTKDNTVAPNGALFTKKFKGVFGNLIELFKVKRGFAKNSMKDIKKIMIQKGSSNEELDKSYSKFNVVQGGIKILMNSLYGACGTEYFRYYNETLASAITTTGQYIIKTMFFELNKELNKLFKTDNYQYCIYCHTDSVLVRLEDVVNKYFPDKKTEEIVDLVDKLVEGKIKPIILKLCDQLHNKFNAYLNNIDFKREAIADVGLWLAKNRYIMSVWDNEGVRYKTPEIKITGLEIIKSSVPSKVREKLREVVPTFLYKTEEDLHNLTEEFEDIYKTVDLVSIALPTGINDIEKYYDESTIFKKGCPIYVKAALLYNKFLVDNKLTGEYRRINSGDKIKYVFLEMPNTLHHEVIAFIDKLPKEFGLEEFVDYRKLFEKTFMAAIERLTTAIGWQARRSNSSDWLFE